MAFFYTRFGALMARAEERRGIPRSDHADPAIAIVGGIAL